MGRKARSGQKRKEKNIRRSKRKVKKEIKKNISITKRETVCEKIPSAQKLLDYIKKRTSIVSHTNLIEQLNKIVNRDALSLDDEAYEYYLDVRNELILALKSESDEILKSVKINVGIDFSNYLDPVSADMMFNKFKTGSKETFIQEMLNKACGFDIVSEEQEEIYNKPINFEVKYWIMKEGGLKVSMLFKFFGDKSHKCFYEDSENTKLTTLIKEFVKL